MGKELAGYTPTEIITDEIMPLTHKEECALFNEEWNRDKQIRRMKNVQIAHGFIPTGEGITFFHNGVSGTIYKRTDS